MHPMSLNQIQRDSAWIFGRCAEAEEHIPLERVQHLGEKLCRLGTCSDKNVSTVVDDLVSEALAERRFFDSDMPVIPLVSYLAP